MLSDINVRRNLDNGTMRELNGNFDESLQSELELMLQQQHNYDIIDKQREINIYRSGSAPPTVEGSLSAVGSLLRNPNLLLDNCSNNAHVLLSEEEIRSHPAYLSYYYSHENLNPRLPPPLLSREDWRVAQKFQARGLSFGGVADWTKEKTVGVDGSSSLFSMQPSSFVKEAEDKLMEISEVNRRNLSRASSTEWLDRGSDGLIGLSNARLGIRKKSFADILQEGLDQPASLSGHLSRPASSSSFSDIVEKTGISSHHAAELYNGGECTEALHRRGINPSMPRVQSFSAAVSHSSVSEMAAALSRSRTPEPQQIGRSQSPCIPLMSNRVGLVEKKNISSSNTLDGLSISTKDIAAAISSLSLSNNQVSHEDSFVQPQHKVGFDNSKSLLNMSNIDKSTAAKFTIPNSCVSIMGTNAIVREQNASKLGIDDEMNFPQTSSSVNLYSNNTFGSTNSEGSNISYQNDTFSTMGSLVEMPSGCSVDKNLKFSNHRDAGSNLIGRRNGLLSSNHQVWSDHHLPDVDACYIQYMQKASDYAIASSDHPSRGRSHLGTSHPDERLQNLQEAYVETLLTHQKNEYDTFLHKSNGLHHGYYLNSHFGLSIPYEGKATAKSVHPSGRSKGPIRKNGRNSRFNTMSRTSVSGSSGSLHSDAGTKMEDVLASSLLAELKSNKTRSLELVDVVDNVVEFSMDQYGSRFIQQNLETATVEEKTKIFPEIISYARALMTDVFGNYVIQKFFEHGTESQRKDLARQLIGHVLPLSLQMYGCRVIQKALEVVDVEHQTLLVAELDGSVMKCVRDQNGNHVIQKCIECIPQERIQFIISSFFGQVVALSTHPYGCRVIQRVLERCDVPKTQVVMDEIIHSACILAQDQYGNYVIQHVLQHGKLHERSAIISKLAGQIVEMSQQKFASNVVEKCLTFGGPEERQLLVNEMLGSTDENEPLQAMMKDPFGNYVVQKVLETCDYESCELILSRIKVHLSALKRYTYSKHIVSRVEKLITTGDRRSGFPLPYCT